MKIYILFEHDCDGKEVLAAFYTDYSAQQAAHWLEVVKWETGYSDYGGIGFHVEEVEVA